MTAPARHAVFGRYAICVPRAPVRPRTSHRTVGASSPATSCPTRLPVSLDTAASTPPANTLHALISP